MLVKNNQVINMFKWPIAMIAIGLSIGFSGSTFAALVLSQQPTNKQPKPNIIVSVDDSHSMRLTDIPGSTGTRLQVLQAALHNSFSPAKIPDNSIRLTWQAFNSCGQGLNTAGCNPFRVLDSTQRATFFNWVDNLNTTYIGTPIHKQMQNVVSYASSVGTNGFWAANPGVSETPLLECRRAYHIIMSDGGWNTITVGQRTPNGNEDGTARTLPDGTAYDPTSNQTHLYADAWGNGNYSTLADFAFYLWATDFSSMPNSVVPITRESGTTTIGGVPISQYWNVKNDPATWQHVNTYTIGFGPASTQWTPQNPLFDTANNNMYAADYPNLVNGTATWKYNPINDPNLTALGVPIGMYRPVELWHMAFNGRGKFVPAVTASALSQAFDSIFSDITADTAAPLVSIATSSSSLKSDTNVFLAGYDASTWSGSLVARSIDANGAIGVNDVWSASALLNASGYAPQNRVALTYNGSQGIPFAWTSLSATEQTTLNATDGLGVNRVDYIRGSHANEANNGGTFRNRQVKSGTGYTPNILGDIVNSNILYVGKPQNPSTAADYATFRAGNQGRAPIVYVGANDGMLHGFSATTGAEVLAYVPSGLLAPLVNYTNPGYVHHYFVDGSPFSGDVKLNNTWKTVLATGMGTGSKGYAILDVTNPANFNQNNASSLVLADTTDTSVISNVPLKNNIGYITTPPATDSYYTSSSTQVTKMNDGHAAVIFGNGFNSTTEDAALIIHFLNGDPSVVIPVGKPGNNGLSTPQIIDVDGDGQADIAYAGDLQGNMWKFDLTSSNSSAWHVALNGNALFTAKDSNGVSQPITTAPTWLPNPLGGIMLGFGTGRNVAEGDGISTQQQTIYGIYDNSKINMAGNAVSIVDGTVVSGRNQAGNGQLIAQTPTSVNGSYSGSTSNPINYNNAQQRGWYFDLPVSRERVTLSNPNILGGSLFYVFSTIPSAASGEESCIQSSATDGYFNVFNLITGAPPVKSVFTGVTGSYSRVHQSGALGGAGSILSTGVDSSVLVKACTGNNCACPVGENCDPTKIQLDFEGVLAGWHELKF